MVKTGIDLFDWLMSNMQSAKYDLANSNIAGISYDDYKTLSGFDIPADFDLGIAKTMGADVMVDWLARKYNCDRNMVLTTTGGSEANFLVFHSHLKRGDEIVIERPGYSPMWITPQSLGVHVWFWHRHYKDGFALDIESLKNLITPKTKLVVLTNLHNPSGVLARPESIKVVVDIARENRAKVLIDEMFLDAAFDEQISSVGMDSVIVTASTSKIYGLSGLRAGWIIADKETVEQCLSSKALVTGSSGHLGEVMTGHILNVATENIYQRFRKVARANFETVSKWMKDNSDVIEWVEPAGGVVSFPKYKGDMDSITLCKKLLEEYGILLAPGTYFNLDGHFRLTYRNNPEVLKPALESLSKGLHEIL